MTTTNKQTAKNTTSKTTSIVTSATGIKPSRANILRLLKQAVQEGDRFVFVQRGNYTQVGLRSTDGKVSNITAAICAAYDIEHKGISACASERTIRTLLGKLAVEPITETIANPVTDAASQSADDAQPMVKYDRRSGRSRHSNEGPDFDNMTPEEIAAYIVANPDKISGSKSTKG